MLHPLSIGSAVGISKRLIASSTYGFAMYVFSISYSANHLGAMEIERQAAAASIRTKSLSLRQRRNRDVLLFRDLRNGLTSVNF